MDTLSPLERVQRVHAARGARARPFSRDRVRARSATDDTCIGGLLGPAQLPHDDTRHARRLSTAVRSVLLWTAWALMVVPLVWSGVTGQPGPSLAAAGAAAALSTSVLLWSRYARSRARDVPPSGTTGPAA